LSALAIEWQICGRIPVKSLFPLDTFSGFGSTCLHPYGFAPLVHQIHGRNSVKLRSGVRADAPRLPGVYGMVDHRGQLIYVGKAKSLRARLMSYFRVRSRDPKAGRIIRHTQSIVWESMPDEFGALVRELELIRRFRPRFNVQGMPNYRRYIYICLGRAPAPYTYATREPTGKELAVYGPFVGAPRARDAARRINDAFRLRDCSQRQTMRFAEERDLFALELAPGCLRYDIGTCLGPCAGFCSRTGYFESIQSVRSFLEGVDRQVLHDLEAEMIAASAAQHYERAMAVRDKLADLRWLTDRLVWLRNARLEHSYLYPLTGPDERTVWYLIDKGLVRGAVYRPSDRASRLRAARQIDKVYSDPTASGTIMPKGQVDSVLLVAAWFRKRPPEKIRCIKWGEAKSLCGN
jgi:excinuclease ABC subunit C